LLAGALASISYAEPAKGPVAGNSYWKQAAISDVEAAYRMLRDDHPGAAPQFGDAAFRRTLASAHALAAARAKTVSSFAGYSATMAGFANAFGDKHLRSRPILELSRPDWAGIILVKRGTHWWLLISEGNPFVARPQTCIFSDNAELRPMKLQWRPIKRAELDVRLQKASPFGASGFGVRRVGAGYWIALQNLMNSAVPVVEAVKTQADTFFTNVRDTMLPSGLSTFSTMMAVNVGGEPRLGPFVPTHLYDGDISDTSKVEGWVMSAADGGAN
jgi:hypothetical protein